MQGAALARVGARWLTDAQAAESDHDGVILPMAAALGLRLLSRVHGAAGEQGGTLGHAAPIFGLLSAALGIPLQSAVRAFSFANARDALSSAIRLDLVGPLQAVGLMSTLASAARDGERASEHAAWLAIIKAGHAPLGSSGADGEQMLHEALLASSAARWASVRHAAGSAPVLDTLHSCHDLLEMRLFQT